MRLLFDANLSPGVADALSEVGHEVVGVFDVGLADASDTTILARADSEQRVIVSHDTDFGALLARHDRAIPVTVMAS